jgi:hypothetical protein
MRPHTPRRFGTAHVPLAEDGLPADSRCTPRGGTRTPRDDLLLAAYAQLQQENRPPQGPSVVPWRPPTRSDSRCAYLRSAAVSPPLPVATEAGSVPTPRPASAECQIRSTPIHPPKGCPFSKLSPRTAISRSSSGSVSPRVDDDTGLKGPSARFSLIDLPAPGVKGLANFARTPSREQDAFSKGVGPAPTVLRLQEMINSRSRPGAVEGRNEALEMLLEDYNNMVMGHRQQSTIRAKAAMRNNHRFQRYSLPDKAQTDNFLRPRVQCTRIVRPQSARKAPVSEEKAREPSNTPLKQDFYVPPPEVIHTAAKMSRTTGREAKVPGTAERCDALCFAVPAPPTVPTVNLQKLTPRAQSASTKYRGFLFSADDSILHTRPRSAFFSGKGRSGSNEGCSSPTAEK